MFKIKYNINSLVVQNKIQLRAQNFLQISRVEFTKIFTRKIRKKLLKIYLAICMLFGLIIYQINLKEMYLKSLLDDNEFLIYIKPLTDIEQIKKKFYYRLLQSLYIFKLLRYF